MKCRRYNDLGLGILTFQLLFSEPHVSTVGVGGLTHKPWLSDTKNQFQSVFLKDTKVATPLRSDMASDMWTGKHVPNVWKQNESDQGRGTM